MTTQHTNFKTISGKTQNYDFFSKITFKKSIISRDSISLRVPCQTRFSPVRRKHCRLCHQPPDCRTSLVQLSSPDFRDRPQADFNSFRALLNI
jgi:hypothetical protein